MVCSSSSYNPLVLAYLGDAYFEILAREYLAGSGDVRLSELNRRSKCIVTAGAQAAFARRMLPLLNEKEIAVFKSGRNAKSPHRSKSSTAIDYRFATGLECLYGYYWVCNMQERAKSLFLKCVLEDLEG